MSEAIAITNQKGGVGKTTTVVNLAVALVQQGKRVVVVDADPQANTTSQLAQQAVDPGNNICAMMDKVLQQAPIMRGEGVVKGKYGVDLVPSSIVLAGKEMQLSEQVPAGRERSSVLKKYTDTIKGDYDFMLFDTNPSLGNLTINALTAADSVLIPLEPATFSMDGLDQLAQTIAAIRRTSNPGLAIKGALFTRYNPQFKSTKIIESTLRTHYSSLMKIYENSIPARAAAVNAQYERQSVFEYDKHNAVSKAYASLAAEIAAPAGRRQGKEDKAHGDHNHESGRGRSSAPSGATVR